jgi:ABC-type multidrug transport system fused ATPase/permease subunit
LTYDGYKAALQKINAHIEPGLTVGLVGKSGSGKSSFVNLILGLYRPQQGCVKIDGQDINMLDMRSVRRFCSVVSQDPILFRGTIFENIAHGLPNASLAQVMQAAEVANAQEFIYQMPQGYNSLVGEGGVTLSGGQKQRIALARAVLRNPAILILDEATSALDTASEKKVQAAIDRMSGNQTTFIIAHRLSTVRNVDIILVFKNGQICEQGSHDELLATQGEYASLLQFQLDQSPQVTAV